MFIRLLGAVGAGPDEASVVPAPGRIAAGVLAHLALAGGRLVTTEAIASSVWDEAPESSRNAIQVAVSKLRRLHGADLIRSTRSGYQLPTGVMRVDWTEAEQLLAFARIELAGGRAHEALAATRSIAALFTGEPLTGLSSTAADTARERAHQLRAAARLIHAEALRVLGRDQEAAQVLQDAVAADPLNEPAHAALLVALGEAGRRTDALVAYHALRARLATELGANPSPELQEIFLRLLSPTPRAAVPTLNGARHHPDSRGGAHVTGAVKSDTSRLPTVAAPIVGRDEEIAQICELFDRGHRLVTLVGAGGIGKTRLAVSAASTLTEQLQVPAIFVDLTLARAPQELNAVMLTALGADGDDPNPALHARAALLILDNAEHLLDAVADLALAALANPGTAVLVTSRSPLRLRDERPYAVGPLQDPADAVTILVERSGLTSHQVQDGAADLHALASWADGMPLVLELLASALRWRTPHELLGDLTDILPQWRDDARDRPSRHLSLTTTTDWTIGSTPPAVRSALAALTLPRGPFSIEAAIDILSAPPADIPPRALLAELVDRSLLQRMPGAGDVIFRLLEPLRLYAESSALIPTAAPQARAAHAAHYWSRLEVARPTVDTSFDDELATLSRTEDANLRAALEWLLDHDPDRAMDSLGDLLWTWMLHVRYEDLIAVSRRALDCDAGSKAARIRVAAARLRALHDAQEHEREWAALATMIETHDSAELRCWRSRFASLGVQIAQSPINRQ